MILSINNEKKEIKITTNNINNLIPEYNIPKDIYILLYNEKYQISNNMLDDIFIVKGIIKNILFKDDNKFDFGCKYCNSHLNDKVNDSDSLIYCDWCKKYVF